MENRRQRLFIYFLKSSALQFKKNLGNMWQDEGGLALLHTDFAGRASPIVQFKLRHRRTRPLDLHVAHPCTQTY